MVKKHLVGVAGYGPLFLCSIGVRLSSIRYYLMPMNGNMDASHRYKVILEKKRRQKFSKLFAMSFTDSESLICRFVPSCP